MMCLESMNIQSDMHIQIHIILGYTYTIHTCYINKLGIMHILLHMYIFRSKTGYKFEDISFIAMGLYKIS